jgi:hypothetical protein
MDDSPGSPILDQKIERVKLYEYIIITCEAMNGEQIFGCSWDMKNIAEMKVLSRVTNY